MPEIQNPNILEGTLSYLAPEQTGRMNRGIDYRADFYSFGITLYQLLTRTLPFTSDDGVQTENHRKWLQFRIRQEQKQQQLEQDQQQDETDPTDIGILPVTAGDIMDVDHVGDIDDDDDDNDDGP